jgi:hypothetical protein
MTQAARLNLVDAASAVLVAGKRRKGQRGSDRGARRWECRAPRLFVVSERLRLEPSAFVAILENVGDADCGVDPLDPAL